jgi:integrase/recombinase XerC
MDEGIREFEYYLKRRYPGSSTAKHYISDLQLFQRLVDKPPREVTRLDVDRFIEHQLARGLSAATVNRRLASLHHFFEYLADESEDDTWANPVVWRRHRVKEGKPLPRDVSDAEVEWLFATIDHPRDRLMFNLMYQVGLRVGEVAALRVSDLIRADNPAAGVRLRVRGKGQKERVVPLTPDLVQQWHQWLAQRPQVTTDALFLTRRRQGISVRGIQERLNHYCHQAGVQFTCHQLRHTFGRRMAEGEMPLPSLSKLLGHAEITTTQVYIAGAAVEVRADYEAAIDRLETQAPADSWTRPEPSLPVHRQADDQKEKAATLKSHEERLDLSSFWGDLPPWLTGPLDDYLVHQQRRWTPSQSRHHARTRAQALRQIWRWLVEEQGVSRVAALGRQDVQAYVQARLEAGVAASTLNRELRDLWAFLRFLEDQGQPISPGLFRLARLKEHKPLPRFLDEAAYQRLETQLLSQTHSSTRDDQLDRAWFYLLAHAGLRLGELCDLRLGDLDLAGRRLAVRQGKGMRDRILPLSTTTCQVLGDYLALRGPALTDHLLIFAQGQIKPTLVQARLRRYGAAVGVAVSPHRLRHTLATRLVNAGMDIISIQRLLGHEKLDTTMIYAHVHDTTMERDFYQAMARLATDREQLPIPVHLKPVSLADELFSHALPSASAQTQAPDCV